MKRQISFSLNGQQVSSYVEPQTTLLTLLREEFQLTGAKEGCGVGECGACTVIVDDLAINACLFPALEAHQTTIITIEGLDQPNGALDPLQESFVEKGAVQCGFCTPGMIMSAKALLLENPHPKEHEIRSAIDGNICRCTGYQQIVKAIKAAGEKKA